MPKLRVGGARGGVLIHSGVGEGILLTRERAFVPLKMVQFPPNLDEEATLSEERARVCDWSVASSGARGMAGAKV